MEINRYCWTKHLFVHISILTCMRMGVYPRVFLLSHKAHQPFLSTVLLLTDKTLEWLVTIYSSSRRLRGYFPTALPKLCIIRCFAIYRCGNFSIQHHFEANREIILSDIQKESRRSTNHLWRLQYPCLKNKHKRLL